MFDLVDQAGDKAEVAAGDASEGGDCFDGGEIVACAEAQVGPLAVQDVSLFVGGEGFLVVDEADSGVELGVAGEALFDLCPQTGRARLGYERARVLLDKRAGLDLHQLRHSAATHLGDAEIPLQLIMGKTQRVL